MTSFMYFKWLYLHTVHKQFFTTYNISKVWGKFVCIIKGYLHFFVITFSQTSSHNISEDIEGGLIRISGTIITGPTRPFGFAFKSLSV